jgi:opacity protein-like surface antigen
MKLTLQAGLATAALAVSTAFAPAFAGGLGDKFHGSKGYAHASYAEAPRGPAGPCYFRADLGYSVSKDPSVKWPVSNIDRTYIDNNTNGVFDTGDTLVSSISTYVGDAVSNATIENTWFGAGGIGCSSGSYGVRGELMLGYHGARKLDGVPFPFTVTDNGIPPAAPVDDPLHTSIKSYTLMMNGYKDLGRWGNITPYVGAGVGLAYNKMDEVYFTQNVFLTNRIQGEGRLSLAWSLMAGVGIQLTDRAILDVGYRYLDLGKAQSGRVDNAGFVNPRVLVDDLAAHEFKVGLRYHFGGSDCCAAPAYAPMK